MHKKHGFSILEIMVAIAVLGLLAAIVVPNLRRPKGKDARDKFLLELNSLTSFALQNAIKTKKVQQVFFNFAEGKRVISLNISTGKDKYGKDQYSPVTRAYAKTKIKMIDQFELKNFYINGKDEAPKINSSKTQSGAWFFVADGNCQPVIINYLDNNQDKSGKSKRPTGLVLNPFSAQFEVFDEFKKP